MRDYIFFPLAALALAGMAAAALAPGPERLRASMALFADPEAGFRLSGGTLDMLQWAESLSVDMIALPDGRTVAQMGAFVPYDLPPLSQGVFITLPPDFAAQLAGRRIRIELEARRSPSGGSPVMLVAYVGGAGRQDTGWNAAQLTGTFEEYAFEFDLPPDPPENAPDYVAIWPDREGLGRTIDVLSVGARIVPSPGPDAGPDAGPAGISLRGDNPPS